MADINTINYKIDQMKEMIKKSLSLVKTEPKFEISISMFIFKTITVTI